MTTDTATANPCKSTYHIWQDAAVKALRLGMPIFAQTERVYLCRSASLPGKFHRLVIRDERVHCECPAGAFKRDGICWHKAGVSLMLRNERLAEKARALRTYLTTARETVQPAPAPDQAETRTAGPAAH